MLERRTTRSLRLPFSGLLLASLLGSPLALARSPIKSVEISTPRTFGYFIGDTVRHEIRIELDTPYRLNPESVPEPGRMNRWVELRRVESSVTESPKAYHIALTYQIFNSARPGEVPIVPAHRLSIEGAEAPLTVMVPAWPFSVKNLVQTPNAAASGDTFGGVDMGALRLPHPPPRIATEPYRRRAIIAAVLLLAALATIGFVQGFDWLARRINAPFSRALRELRRLQRKPQAPPAYPQALKTLHRAFNATAGKAVFTGNLDEFFHHNPRYVALRGPIANFYAESQRRFFDRHEGQKRGVSPPADFSAETINLVDLVALARACRALEREHT